MFKIITDSDQLNEIKVITKVQKKESLFKYQPLFYNVQSSDTDKHIGITLLWNNEFSPSLNIIYVKTIRM